MHRDAGIMRTLAIGVAAFALVTACRGTKRYDAEVEVTRISAVRKD